MVKIHPIHLFQVRAAQPGILTEIAGEQGVSIDMVRSGISVVVVRFAAQQKEYV